MALNYSIAKLMSALVVSFCWVKIENKSESQRTEYDCQTYIRMDRLLRRKVFRGLSALNRATCFRKNTKYIQYKMASRNFCKPILCTCM